MQVGSISNYSMVFGNKFTDKKQAKTQSSISDVIAPIIPESEKKAITKTKVMGMLGMATSALALGTGFVNNKLARLCLVVPAAVISATVGFLLFAFAKKAEQAAAAIEKGALNVPPADVATPVEQAK